MPFIDRSPFSRDGDEEVARVELHARQSGRRGHAPARGGFPDFREVGEARRLSIYDEAMVVAARRLYVPADALGLPEIEGSVVDGDGLPRRDESGIDRKVR